MKLRRLLWLVVVGALATAVAADDYVMSRYDLQRTGYTAEKVAPPLALLWKFSTGEDPGLSAAPLVLGDQIIFCALGTVYALDGGTGGTNWEYPTRFAIRATPHFLNDRLYVLAVNGDMHVLDPLTGNPYQILEFRGGVSGEPLVLGNLMYIVDDSGRLSKVDLSTLEQTELERFNNGPRGPLTTDGQYLIFTGADNLVYCYDLRRERRLWAHSQGSLVTPPSVLDDAVIVGNAEGVVRLRTRSGRADWVQRSFQAARGGAALAGGFIYLADRNDTIHKVEPRKGQIVTSFDLRSIPQAPLTIANESLYAGTLNGNLWCLSTGDLTPTWAYRCSPLDTLGENRPKYAINTAPVVANGYVLVATTQGTLFCFRADAFDVGEPKLLEPRLVTVDVEGGAYVVDLIDDELRAALVEQATAEAEEGEEPEIPEGAEDVELPGKQHTFRFETYVYDEGSGARWDQIRVKWDNEYYASELIEIDPATYQLKVHLVSPKAGLARAQIANGLHTINLTVPDFKGNVLERNFSFTIDNTLPPLEPQKKKETTQPGEPGMEPFPGEAPPPA